MQGVSHADVERRRSAIVRPRLVGGNGQQRESGEGEADGGQAAGEDLAKWQHGMVLVKKKM